MAFNFFFEQVSALFDKHALLHKLSKKKYFKTKPRIHKGIQFSMEKRDKLLKIYCNESDSILKATKQNNFKIVIPYVISKIKESKKQYYQRYSQKYSTNIKKNWDGIRSIVALTAKAKTSWNSSTLKGVTTTNKKCTVETFKGTLM